MIINMMKKFLVLLLTSVCIVCQAADFDHPLNLSELIDIAMTKNPLTHVAWRNAKRASAALGMAKSANYPSFGVESFIKNGRDFKFVNGPNTDYTIIGADLVLSMMLFDFGERQADIESAKYALSSAHWQTNWTLQKVMLDVLENAYALIHAEQLVNASSLSQEDAEIMMNSAVQLHGAGLVPITDVYTSRSTLAQMKMDTEKQKGLRNIQNGKLIAGLGISADVNLQLARIDVAPPVMIQKMSELIALANEQRADLLAKQSQLSESLAKQNKVKTLFRPRLALAATGGVNHAIHDKTNGCQYQALLSFSFPIFDGFQNFYQRSMAYNETQITAEELAKLRLDISLDVLTYRVTLETAQEMFIYAEDHLNNARMAYEGVLERYQAGKEHISEVSNAHRQLLAARIRYSDVLTQLRVAAAYLAYSTGALLR